MQTQVALAFAWQLLNAEQRTSIKARWASLPLGRFLFPFEVGRILKIRLEKTVRDQEDESMRLTWIDFCHERDLTQDALPMDHDEWFDWLEYSLRHYVEILPMPKTDWGAA
jgi:hypothetical protein